MSKMDFGNKVTLSLSLSKLISLTYSCKLTQKMANSLAALGLRQLRIINQQRDQDAPPTARLLWVGSMHDMV